MPIEATRVHLPPQRIRQIENDCQAGDFFWTGGYEFDTPKHRSKDRMKKQPETEEEVVDDFLDIFTDLGGEQ